MIKAIEVSESKSVADEQVSYRYLWHQRHFGRVFIKIGWILFSYRLKSSLKRPTWPRQILR